MCTIDTTMDRPSQQLNIHLYATGTAIDKYPAKAHAQRVAEKLEASTGVIVLAATPAALYPDSDQPVVFRQDRYFYYLSGCNEAGCYVTYDIGRDVLGLWLPEIDKRRVVWSGRGSTVEEALARYDIDEAYYISSGQGGAVSATSELRYVVEGVQRGDAVPDVYAMIAPSRTSTSIQQEKGRQLQYALDACRVIKDEHEIALIQRANEITAEAHTAVLHQLHSLTSESEVEAEYMRVCIARHAREQAYSPIAGSGPNASVLHYVKNDEDFGDRQMMVLDAGCEVSCYASDVTRGIPLNKRNPGTWPSKEAENVYKLVERVQEACIAEMRPGKSFVEIAMLSYDMTLDGLLQLGILRGHRDEIRKAKTHLGFFPHGLGHHLGLEVHDVSPHARPKARSHGGSLLPATFGFASGPPYPFSGAGADTVALDEDTSRLQPGMVVTIEPGLYFNAYLLDNFFLNAPKHAQFIDTQVLKRYMPVGGVRIEDDILVTKHGYENLTTAPKGEAMLECIRKGAGSGAR